MPSPWAATRGSLTSVKCSDFARGDGNAVRPGGPGRPFVRGEPGRRPILVVPDAAFLSDRDAWRFTRCEDGGGTDLSGNGCPNVLTAATGYGANLAKESQ
jgi:hypothetical protein